MIFDVLWGETGGIRKPSWIWNMRCAAPDGMEKDGSLEGKISVIHCVHSLTARHRQIMQSIGKKK
jgi:hypothetical protein